MTTRTKARQIFKGKKAALIVIDLQYDFLPGGSLAVPDGDKTISVINQLRDRLPFDCVVLSQDWHPKDHSSFGSNNGNAELFSVKKLNGLDQVMWVSPLPLLLLPLLLMFLQCMHN